MTVAARPKFVKIGPYKFRIIWMPVILTDDGEPAGLDGYSSIGDETIVVRTTMTPAQERATLLHEVLHMCLAVSGCLLDSGRIKRGAVEETAVRAIEAPLFGVLRENPRLVAYLLG